MGHTWNLNEFRRAVALSKYGEAAAGARKDTGNEMSAALWGVIIGGLLTIGGQTVAELLKARAQSTAREADRATAARDFHRDALERATQAATTLQSVYVEYEAVQGTPSPQLELRLRQAASEFERLVPRVNSAQVRGLLETWESAAQSWSNGDGTQQAENNAWSAAVKACGEAVRSYL